MRLEHNGKSVWYGAADAAAPLETVRAGTEVLVTVGVQPADASNKVELVYRINQGPPKTAAAEWAWNDPGTNAQYFTGRLPAFRPGDSVEYYAVCLCAGQRIPSAEEESQFS